MIISNIEQIKKTLNSYPTFTISIQIKKKMLYYF